MNTEKLSTSKDQVLTWDSVKSLIDDIDCNPVNLHVPLGINESGNLATATMKRGPIAENAVVCGLTGSGKSCFVTSTITCLKAIYGSTIKIHYFDGKGVELGQWYTKEKNLLGKSAGIMRDVAQKCNFYVAVDILTKRFKSIKVTPYTNEVLIFDDINRYLKYEETLLVFESLVELANSCRVNCILASQGNDSCVLDNFRDWNHRIALRLTDEMSEKLIGSKDAGSLADYKHGYCWYITDSMENAIKCRTIFINSRDIKDRCWINK